jgi:hypothetical protein
MKNLDEYNKTVPKIDNRADVLCPICDTEMLYLGTLLLSNPPLYQVYCSNTQCNYIGAKR